MGSASNPQHPVPTMTFLADLIQTPFYMVITNITTFVVFVCDVIFVFVCGISIDFLAIFSADFDCWQRSHRPLLYEWLYFLRCVALLLLMMRGLWFFVNPVPPKQPVPPNQPVPPKQPVPPNQPQQDYQEANHEPCNNASCNNERSWSDGDDWQWEEQDDEQPHQPRHLALQAAAWQNNGVLDPLDLALPAAA